MPDSHFWAFLPISPYNHYDFINIPLVSYFSLLYPNLFASWPKFFPKQFSIDNFVANNLNTFVLSCFLFLQHLHHATLKLGSFSYSNSHPNSSPLQDENHRIMHADTATNSLFTLCLAIKHCPKLLYFPNQTFSHFSTTAIPNLQLLLKSLFTLSSSDRRLHLLSEKLQHLHL